MRSDDIAAIDIALSRAGSRADRSDIGVGLGVGLGAGRGMDGDAWLGVRMASCLGPAGRQNQLPKIKCR
jgi:hypothetical protein